MKREDSIITFSKKKKRRMLLTSQKDAQFFISEPNIPLINPTKLDKYQKEIDRYFAVEER